MIFTALNNIRTWSCLSWPFKNFSDEYRETLHKKLEKVLLEIATQANKLFEHNDSPHNIYDEKPEVFAPINNTDLEISSIA
jgi:hypothetical protein